ncbi:MAG: hypothetical protein ACRC35_02115 [Angustibacter sp.]
MSEDLSTVLVLYLSLVAGFAVAAALGAPVVRAATAGAGVAQALLVATAALDLVRVLRGPQPADPATHLGYVAASVALLPLLTGRRLRREPGRTPVWRSADLAVLALACAALVVVVVRQRSTGT